MTGAIVGSGVGSRVVMRISGGDGAIVFIVPALTGAATASSVRATKVIIDCIMNCVVALTDGWYDVNCYYL